MREISGIMVSFLLFLLLAVYTVEQHDTARTLQNKTAQPSLPASPPSLTPATEKSSTNPPAPSVVVKEPLVPPAGPLHGQFIAAVPAPPPNSQPDKMIYFQSGCTGLSRDNQTVLNSLLPALRKAPQAQIEIHGYSDNMGHPQFNQDLSRLRADIVHYYLLAQGVAESRFIVGGHGSALPTSSNDSATGRRRNRRTEIFIHQESLRKSS